MAARRPPRSRSLPLLVFVALANALAAACGRSEVTSDPSSVALPARTPPPAGDSGAPGLDVGGFVMNDDNTPIIGRPLDLVDARGRHFPQLTDEGGAFWALGAMPPYDVLVGPAPSGSVITPIAVLGLTRADPRIGVSEHDGADAKPAYVLVPVTVTLPPCQDPAQSCFVSITSASATGRGVTIAWYSEAGPTAFAVEHVFTGADVPAGETLDVHVLAGDADYTQYAYATAHGVTADAGATLTPVPVEASEPVVIAAQSSGVPPGWDFTLSSELELVGGALVTLRWDWATSSLLRLPVIPGARWRAAASAVSPMPDDPSLPRLTSQARSGSLPIPSDNVALDLPSPPSSVSFSDGVIAWRGARSLSSVIVIDDTRGAQRFRAYTSEGAVSLERLAALGLPALEAGNYSVDLATTAGADVDAFAEPDERVRGARFGLDQPGGGTYQRARFTVTR